MLRLKPTSSTIVGIILVFLVILNTFPLNVYAGLNSTKSNACVDVLLVFTRGSGQNQNHELVDDPLNPDFKDLEPESYAFFNWFKHDIESQYPHLDYKAVSVHDFEGKYDSVGYKAARIGAMPIPAVANMVNAEWSWFPGDYRESVEHGVTETYWYIKDQLESCPDQYIMVGGYSQGAQVMGDVLSLLNIWERSRILGAGFVGDPKFIASTDNPLNPLDKAVSYPWRRGTATNKDRGMLEARVPYVPSDMSGKTVSWCVRIDVVCAGWSGAHKDSREAHGVYSGEPMRNTVSELMQFAAPTLASIERSRGGMSSEEGVSLGTQTDTKARDIKFLLNDGSTDTVRYVFRYGFDTVMYPISQAYPNTRYAANGYREWSSSGVNHPVIETVFPFKAYERYYQHLPPPTLSNLSDIINKRYPFGQGYYQSGDYTEPLGLVVEKAAVANDWRPDAEKHIILFTDRTAKDPYTYSNCFGSPYAWVIVPTSGYSTCYDADKGKLLPKAERSEVCETVYLVITESFCQNKLPDKGLLHIIQRTLGDVATIAQSQKVAVTVVVPHKLHDQYKVNDLDNSLKKLKLFAESTGGKFIYYDQRPWYDKALFSDTLHQVFGNTPQPFTITHITPLDNTTQSTDPVISEGTHEPVVLDVSRSGRSFAEYKWDFDNNGSWDETTPGPVTEHVFTAPETNFVRVAGIDEAGTIAAETRIATAITAADPPVEPIPPTVPTITAVTNQDGSITLTWQSSESGELLIIDPETNVPFMTASLAAGQLTIPSGYTSTSLNIRAMNEEAIGDAQTITVAPWIPLEVVVEEENEEKLAEDEQLTTGPEQADPTLCYKLQQCQDESRPEGGDVFAVQGVTGPTASTTTTQAAVAPLLRSDIAHAEDSLSLQPQVAAATTTEQTTPSIVPQHSAALGENTTIVRTDNWLPVIVVVLILSGLAVYVAIRFRRQ